LHKTKSKINWNLNEPYQPDCHRRLMHSSNRKFNILPRLSDRGVGDLTFDWVWWGKLNLKYQIFNFFLDAQTGWNAYNLYILLWQSKLLHYIIRQSTDIPAIINIQHITRVSAAISPNISGNSLSVCRPYIDQHISWASVDMSLSSGQRRSSTASKTAWVYLAIYFGKRVQKISEKWNLPCLLSEQLLKSTLSSIESFPAHCQWQYLQCQNLSDAWWKP